MDSERQPLRRDLRFQHLLSDLINGDHLSPRRLRRSPALRAMVRENQLLPADFIYPLFVHEGAEVEPIGAMPGANRWSLDRLSAEVQRAWDLGFAAWCSSPRWLKA